MLCLPGTPVFRVCSCRDWTAHSGALIPARPAVAWAVQVKAPRSGSARCLCRAGGAQPCPCCPPSGYLISVGSAPCLCRPHEAQSVFRASPCLCCSHRNPDPRGQPVLSVADPRFLPRQPCLCRPGQAPEPSRVSPLLLRSASGRQIAAGSAPSSVVQVGPLELWKCSPFSWSESPSLHRAGPLSLRHRVSPSLPQHLFRPRPLGVIHRRAPHLPGSHLHYSHQVEPCSLHTGPVPLPPSHPHSLRLFPCLPSFCRKTVSLRKGYTPLGRR